jgi:hypothetical protein
MIEWLAGVFVQEPLHIAAVALGLAALSAVGRATVLRDMPKGNVLWVPALLWFGYAAWEWLVLVKTPEADIRVDLLLIWPLIAIVTLWAVARTARGAWSIRRQRR